MAEGWSWQNHSANTNQEINVLFGGSLVKWCDITAETLDHSPGQTLLFNVRHHCTTGGYSSIFLTKEEIWGVLKSLTIFGTSLESFTRRNKKTVSCKYVVWKIFGTTW